MKASIDVDRAPAVISIRSDPVAAIGYRLGLDETGSGPSMQDTWR